MKPSSLILILIIFVLYSCVSGKKIKFYSPDGKVEVILQNNEVSYHFSVILAGDTIVQNSSFGIVLEMGGYDFSNNLSLINAERSTVDETYRMKTGKRLVRRNNCTQFSLEFENTKSNRLVYQLRIFDDAVAYRYHCENADETSVISELSQFHFTGISNIWSIPYSSGDEKVFKKSTTNQLEQSTLSFPVLVETKSNKWALISESDVSNYPLSSGQLKDNALQFVFSNDKIAENKIGSNFSSPWRVIILGENLGNVVESCVIDHLAPPTKMKDLSWVEPGVTSFPWWGNNLANSYPDTLKKYFDLSAEMNWRYVEFDIPLIGSPARAAEYWKSADWIKDVVDYGLEKGVLCYGWDDIKNLNTPEKRDTIFSKYNEFGVRGIKVDFVNSYTQQSRKLVEEVIQDAAKHKLMVSFHGAQSPRGFARTYPHVVTFEAVKGSEYYLEINGAKGVPASHNCILPFTRNVLGSMDYTPVAFSSKIRETTMAHELALSVIFESGWQGICDRPEVYLNSVAKPFLSQLHSTWDETLLLDGYPGEYCCMARRKGDKWFVAGINAGEKRTVELIFPVSGKTVVKMYNDLSDDLNSLFVQDFEIAPHQAFKVTMQKNGGFAFIINNK